MAVNADGRIGELAREGIINLIKIETKKLR